MSERAVVVTAKNEMLHGRTSPMDAGHLTIRSALLVLVIAVKPRVFHGLPIADKFFAPHSGLLPRHGKLDADGHSGKHRQYREVAIVRVDGGEEMRYG